MLASTPMGDQQAWDWIPARADLPVFKGLPQVEPMLPGRDRAMMRLRQMALQPSKTRATLQT